MPGDIKVFQGSGSGFIASFEVNDQNGSVRCYAERVHCCNPAST